MQNVLNCITFVLSRFRTKLLAADRLIIKGAKFDSNLKSSKFLFEIMTQVSSANYIGSDTVLTGSDTVLIGSDTVLIGSDTVLNWF
jgi:hypothetical protein